VSFRRYERSPPLTWGIQNDEPLCFSFDKQLCAFEKLFQDYPEWIGNVVLIQVTSPSLTDSPKLERQVSELVSHINGEYGSLDFIPVHH
jgi:trehalose-6-phosphate synthase